MKGKDSKRQEIKELTQAQYASDEGAEDQDPRSPDAYLDHHCQPLENPLKIDKAEE